MIKIKLVLLVLLAVSLNSFGLDCNLPYGDPPCECCAEKWGNASAPPPDTAFVVFQGIERTACDPGWIMLPPPNDRIFVLRLDTTGDTCSWFYNLDDDIWVIRFDLTAYYNNNVYLANKVDDPPSHMIYFYRRGQTDCRTVYTNELNNWECDGIFFYFFAGGTAQIFWPDSPNFGDFNRDGIVDFKDYAIFVAGKDEISVEYIAPFARNWLQVYD